MKRQHCPICRKSVKPNERYQRYVCGDCARLASSADGRPLGFSNTAVSGGFIATLAGTGVEYPSHVCFVKGIPCWADEARIGGIVIEAIEPTALKSLIDRSGRPGVEAEGSDTASTLARPIPATLRAFVDDFESTFRPPTPSRAKTGKNWLVSRPWSQYMKKWLRDRYEVKFELQLPKRRFLDAALWRRGGDPSRDRMEIALEWEWDNSKVDRHFCSGDFRKLFNVDAPCSVAVIQTRPHSVAGTAQADRIMQNLRDCFQACVASGKSITVFEIRRISHAIGGVEFAMLTHDLNRGSTRQTASWQFP